MNIKLPKIIEADDYHDFDYIEDHLKKMDKRLKCKEVGFAEREAPLSTYIGVIYTSRMPNLRTLKRIVKDEKLERKWRCNIQIDSDNNYCDFG